MSSILDKMRKRRFYPVKIGDETIHVRSMTIGEMGRMEAVEAGFKTPFVVACCLLRDDGSQEFTKAGADVDGILETDTDFAKRVNDALADVQPETLKELCQAVGRIGEVDHEAVLKN